MCSGASSLRRRLREGWRALKKPNSTRWIVRGTVGVLMGNVRQWTSCEHRKASEGAEKSLRYKRRRKRGLRKMGKRRDRDSYRRSASKTATSPEQTNKAIRDFCRSFDYWEAKIERFGNRTKPSLLKLPVSGSNCLYNWELAVNLRRQWGCLRTAALKRLDPPTVDHLLGPSWGFYCEKLSGVLFPEWDRKGKRRFPSAHGALVSMRDRLRKPAQTPPGPRQRTRVVYISGHACCARCRLRLITPIGHLRCP
jgi:hypothetical protein